MLRDLRKIHTSLTVLVLLVPILITNVYAENVTVQWDANTESDLAGYYIYLGQSSRNYATVIDAGNQTEFTWSNLAGGNTYYIAVTAYDFSGNESSYSDEVNVTLEAGDSNSPELIDVFVMGTTQLDLVFSENLSQESAQNISNYTISDGISVLGAILDDDDQKTVHLITSAHDLGQNYVLTVNNITDINGTPIPSATSRGYTMPNPSEDNNSPVLTIVNVVDANHIEVNFSETVEEQSAELVGNYSINNGIQITAAQLNPNLTSVRLTTTEHVNGNYILTVSNVRDRAQSPNSIAPGSQFSYVVSVDNGTIPAVDNTPPAVTSISINGATQLDIHFSEKLDKSTAETRSNYAITPSINIVGAVLNDNQTTVHLITSKHVPENDYTLIVNNVMDIAQNPNEIPDNTQFAYNFERETVEFPGDDIPGDDGGGQTPRSFALYQNYPNPFNPETEIRFYLDSPREVNLGIYNTRGQLIRMLAEDEMSSGYHTLLWDGTNSRGLPVPSGVYFYSLVVNKENQTDNLLVNIAIERRVKRMTLLR